METPLRPQGILLNPLPCPQERGADEANHQPQKAEQMGGTPTLRTGGQGDT